MILLIMMIPHRWVDPEFKDEEDASREVEAGTATGEEVADELEPSNKSEGVEFICQSTQY